MCLVSDKGYELYLNLNGGDIFYTLGDVEMVKSACGFEAIYVYFNGTGLWGGETISMHNGFGVFSSFFVIIPAL